MKLFRTETAHVAIDEIVSLVQKGGVVAYPTDTAYGLGANPFNSAAVDRIFRIKGRPETKPILLLVDSLRMAETIIEPPDVFYIVAKRFWPGPLTIIARAVASLPMNVTAGTKTVGIRWPIAAFATDLVSRVGAPITATSANRSRMPSPITADEVRAQLDESVDVLIDGGTLPSRIGSTVLDLTADLPLLLREGPISFDTLSDFFSGRIRRHAP